MIIANHAHVFPEEIKPSATIDRLKELMDTCGIDKAVAFAPFADRCRECGMEENPNKWLARTIKGDSDIFGFGTVDFERGDLKGQVDMIADLGFKGIKMHPPYQEFRIDGEEAFEVYERAQELGLFLSFHCGMHWHRIKDNLPILFDEVAWNFQNLRFSMEHIGGYHFFRDSLAVMCNNSRGGIQPRVFAGWTSVSNRNGMTGWALTDEELETVILQTGEDSSIFGIDFPYNSAESIMWDIERIKSLNISEQAKENILGATLAKILGI